MNITPFDAWVLGRVMANQDVDPALLDDVSPHWRDRARVLAETPIADRLDASHAMCDALPPKERDALGRAIGAADLLGEPPAPPEREAGPEVEAETWGPLRIGEAPKAEPFPVDVFSPAVRELASEAAMAIGCPLDFVAVPVLAVAGGAIGRSVSLMLKPGYFASANLFAACVGPPSDGKTPALKIASAPLRRIDEALAMEHEQAMEMWTEESERVGSDGKKAKPGPTPKPRRVDIDDATMETIPIILADNPRGLVMVRDELTALVSGLNQYKAGKGSDRATLLKIWSGDAIKRDRVLNENHEPVRCPHPSLSIVGGLPPDMLGELVDAKGRMDGFMDRFLFCYPESPPVPSWSNAGVPDDVADAWAAVVERLWARPMDAKDGRAVPHVSRMTPRAETAWRRLYNEHSAEMNDPGFPPSMRGPWGKFREYAGRLALVLALLDHAANVTLDAAAVPDVAERHIEDAWRLIAYFKSHARRVYAVCNLGAPGPEAAAVKAIIGWLRDGQRESFTERDVKRARPWIDPETLAKALSYMAKANAIRPQEAPQGTASRGRPASPEYVVNPSLLA